MVTGAAGGIGKGLVEALAEADWAVLGSDHPQAVPDQFTRDQCLAWIPAELSLHSQEPKCMGAFVGTVTSAIRERDLLANIHNSVLQHFGNFDQLI